LSDGQTKAGRKGSLEAPTRHALAWQEPQFYDPDSLQKELDRVFDICHGCRRCFNLCNSFPTLFNLIDESATGELDGVDKQAFGQVVDQCYLCDMCYMTKCPYVPPHPWNVDFPHLMLRAKAVKNRGGAARWRDKILSSTDLVGNIAGIPVVAEIVNAVNRCSIGRKVLDLTLGVHPSAPVPPYRSNTLRKQLAKRTRPVLAAQAAGGTRGKVALFATCYGNRNEPEIGLDLVRVFEHNGIEVALLDRESCCGMPKFELGDLPAVAELKEKNLPPLLAMIERGYDIVAPIPSCVLMFNKAAARSRTTRRREG
jgi:Fe-S oxidoreductase